MDTQESPPSIYQKDRGSVMPPLYKLGCIIGIMTGFYLCYQIWFLGIPLIIFCISLYLMEDHIRIDFANRKINESWKFWGKPILDWKDLEPLEQVAIVKGTSDAGGCLIPNFYFPSVIGPVSPIIKVSYKVMLVTPDKKKRDIYHTFDIDDAIVEGKKLAIGLKLPLNFYPNDGTVETLLPAPK